MDLLLADALAAGMARQAAREAQRPPPDNFFILPPDSQVSRCIIAFLPRLILYALSDD